MFVDLAFYAVVAKLLTEPELLKKLIGGVVAFLVGLFR